MATEKLPRYEVETEFKPGVRTNVYRGNDRETAVERCNFWDKRQDTYLIDNAALTPLERANRKFDAKIAELQAA